MKLSLITVYPELKKLDAISINGQVELSTLTHQNQCIIRIKDNGCGISDEQYEKLFSLGSTSSKINGTGLGLFHIKECLTSIDGRISCHRLEKGTLFEISIPIMQTGVVFSSVPDNNPLTVIDDDRLTAQVLKMSGYEVYKEALTFAQGQSLLSIDSKNPVLVDYRLDHQNKGTDLIALGSRRENVFLCTNDYDNLDLIKEARAIGVKIIPKPIVFMLEPFKTAPIN